MARADEDTARCRGRASGNDNEGKSVGRLVRLGFVSFALSVAVVYLIFRRTQGESAVGEVLRIGLGTLLAALALVAASWLVDGLRLYLLTKTAGGPVRFWESVRISVAGAFMSGVTPSDTGGEPLKVYYLHKSGSSIGQATATVTLIAFLHTTTRFLMWLAMPLASLVLGVSWEISPAVKGLLFFGLAVYLFFIALLAGLALCPQLAVKAVVWLLDVRLMRYLIPPTMASKILSSVRRVSHDFREGVARFRTKGWDVALALVLSLIYWVLVMLVPVFLLRRMGSQASFFQLFSLAMTVYLVMAYMPTPGASGGAEVGSALLFAPFLPAKLLATFVLVWRMATYYFTLGIGGALVLLDTLKGSRDKPGSAGSTA